MIGMSWLPAPLTLASQKPEASWTWFQVEIWLPLIETA